MEVMALKSLMFERFESLMFCVPHTGLNDEHTLNVFSLCSMFLIYTQ